MAHTNRGRVILGGLLAGLVINIVEFVTNGVVLKEEWGRTMQALGKPAELSTGAIVIFNIWGFLLGIAAVWLYAAIRPRYSAGPNTAIRAGLVAWAVAVFLPNLGNYPLGLFPTRLLVISSIVALVEIVIATLVGAWLYKEEERASVVRPIAA
jgi:magnesium-transporting ATPase (P-type)